MGDDPADTAQLLRLMGLESPTARVPFLFLLGLAAGESWGAGGRGYIWRGEWLVLLRGSSFYTAGRNLLRIIGLCLANWSGGAAKFGALTPTAHPF